MLRMQRWKFLVSRWLKQHPYFWRHLGIGLLVFTGLSIVVQLAYPAGRVLPFVTVAGESLGGNTTLTVRGQLDKKYARARLITKTQDKTFAKSYEEVGIDPKSWETARSAARYTFGQRLIPFSSVYVMLKRDTPMQITFDDDRLNYFAGEVQKEGFVPAVNASIVVHHGQVSLKSAQSSKEYPAKGVTMVIKQAEFMPVTTVRLAPQHKPAERTNAEVKGVLGEAGRAVNTPLTLKVKDEKITVEKATIGSWLDFPEDPATKKLQLGLQPASVKKYLESIQGKVYKAPGTTHIQIIDGREAGRTEGPPGQGIDADKLIVSLGDALKKGRETTLVVPIAQIAPKVVYDRKYSNSDSGLTALLQDVAAARGYGVSVMEIGGRSAHVNGNKRFVAASTYKLFVAYGVFKQIEAGQMAWSDSVSGNTVSGCFEIMIVRSDNPCAKALGDRLGWQRLEDMMRGLGLTNTELSPQLYTTANDLALFLYKLENGSLVSAADKNRLIDTMKRQIYRAGIPKGTGLAVADKVGFIDSYIHDAGIVYSARGPYAMVIMTSGSSWANIADAARQINAFLGR